MHLKFTVQLESRMRDLEAATYCTLFLPKDSDIVKEMLAIGRHYNNMIEKSCRERKRKPSHMVLQLDGESNRNGLEEQDRRTEPSRPGADRSSEVVQDDNRKHGSPRTGHMDKSMQAPRLGNQTGSGSFLQSKD